MPDSFDVKCIKDGVKWLIIEISINDQLMISCILSGKKSTSLMLR